MRDWFVRMHVYAAVLIDGSKLFLILVIRPNDDP